MYRPVAALHLSGSPLAARLVRIEANVRLQDIWRSHRQRRPVFTILSTSDLDKIADLKSELRLLDVIATAPINPRLAASSLPNFLRITRLLIAIYGKASGRHLTGSVENGVSAPHRYHAKRANTRSPVGEFWGEWAW